MTRALSVVLLAALVGCSAEFGASPSDRASSPETSPPEFNGDDARDEPATLRVDVFPVPGPADGTSLETLPQSFVLEDRIPADTIDLDLLELSETVHQEGAFRGFALNPTIADLPGSEVQVFGTVLVTRPGTIQSYAATIDPDTGLFDAWVIPGDDYRLTVVPNDPLLPLHTEALAVSSTAGLNGPIVVDIGLGVPLYGVVTAQTIDGDQPLRGIRVYAVDSAGVHSEVVRTDDNGRYLIRVQEEGTYTVVCEGPRFLPEWTRRDFADINAGANIDFPYPLEQNPLENVSGEVVSLDSELSVEGTVVRFVASSVDGFEGLLAPGDSVSWTLDEEVDNDGVINVGVVPGAYRVEVIPPTDLPTPETPSPLLGLSPTREVFEQLPADLGTLELPTTTMATRRIQNGAGDPIVGASLKCREVAFGRRTSQGISDKNGELTLELPRVVVSCEVTPPASAGGLAIRHLVNIIPDDIDDPIVLTPGTEFVGTILGPDGAPEPYAWVEVVEVDTDTLVAFGVTNETGAFSVRGELPAPPETTVP